MISCWDPILRAPLFGVSFLSIPISFLGGWLLLRRRILIGEVLSHASYPGVMFAILCSGSTLVFWHVWIGALMFVLLALVLVQYMRRCANIKGDAAFTFVLSTLFGIGTLGASIIQSTHPLLFNQVPIYLYGQAATIGDAHVGLYFCFAVLVVILLQLSHRVLVVLSFDPLFLHTLKLPYRIVDHVFWLLVALSVVLGMRSLGIILLSALMVIPAAAARQWTDRIPVLLGLASGIGCLSAWIGVYLSLLGLPTGPCVTCVALGFAGVSFLIAPNKGVAWRYFRRWRFHLKIQEENVMKRLWMQHPTQIPYWMYVLLRIRGFITSNSELTGTGKEVGARIVRLHRLWELYLVRSLHMGTGQVHSYAEQVEHVLTDEIESQLDQLLDSPEIDPHHQPIPSVKETRS